MRITRIQAVPVIVPARKNAIHSPSLVDPLHMSPVDGADAWTIQFDALPKYVLRLYTDAAITGLGETYRGVQPATIEGIARGLVGRDPMQLNLWDLPIPRSREYDGFEIALFDIVGKKLKVPAYQLLGGAYRNRVLVSAWTGRRTVAEAVDQARAARDAGYGCLKFKASLEDDVVAWCLGIRDACGADFRVLLDPNQRWERPAQALSRLRPLERIGNVLAVEDPVPRWNLEWYRWLREKTDIPVALHVHLPYRDQGQSMTDALAAIEHQAVDYFNFGGAMADVKRLSIVADVAGVSYWHGSEVDLGILEASYLHAAAAARNCTLPSDIFGESIRTDDLVTSPLSPTGDGYVAVPQGPGLGVELDEEALQRYRVDSPKLPCLDVG